MSILDDIVKIDDCLRILLPRLLHAKKPSPFSAFAARAHHQCIPKSLDILGPTGSICDAVEAGVVVVHAGPPQPSPRDRLTGPCVVRPAHARTHPAGAGTPSGLRRHLLRPMATYLQKAMAGAKAKAKAKATSRTAPAPAPAPPTHKDAPNPQQGMADASEAATASTSPLTVGSRELAVPPETEVADDAVPRVVAPPTPAPVDGAAAALAALGLAPLAPAFRPGRPPRSDVRDPRKLFVGGLPPDGERRGGPSRSRRVAFSLYVARPLPLTRRRPSPLFQSTSRSSWTSSGSSARWSTPW